MPHEVPDELAFQAPNLRLGESHSLEKEEERPTQEIQSPAELLINALAERLKNGPPLSETEADLARFLVEQSTGEQHE